MRLPLPTNKLVLLTLGGAVLATGLSVALATPGILGGLSPESGDALPAGAPADDPNFTPAVQSASPAHYADDDEWEDEREKREWEAAQHEADEADER